MKRISRAVIILTAFCLIAAHLTGCARVTELRLFAMDTLLDIRLHGNTADSLEAECTELVSSLEVKLSATIDTSEVSSFNNSERGYTFSDETSSLLSLALRVSDAVGGFDITVYPLVELWDISHAADDWTPPDSDEISDALVHVGADKISLQGNYLEKTDPKTKIDLGGIGKGWAVGSLASTLADEYPEAWGTLSFGGNVATVGNKPDGDYNIALRDPSGDGLVGEIRIESGIVAVSGGYERYVDYDGRRYHHIIDPATGYPSESDLLSAAVYVSEVTPEAGALADALSTALFVLGYERAVRLVDSGALDELCGCEVGLVLITSDGSITSHGALKEDFYRYGSEG